MDGLITVVENNNRQTVSARDLHEALGVKRDFSTWIKNRIEKYGFVEGEEFSPDLAGKDGLCSPNLASKTAKKEAREGLCSPNLVSKTAGRGGHNRIDYLLSVGMAKEIAMVENNEKGREIRRYLIKVEEAWNSPEMVVRRATQLIGSPSSKKLDYAAYMRPAADAADRVYKLQVKYQYTDKVSKPDTDTLFQCAAALKRHYYSTAMVADSLVIHNMVLERKLLRTCRRLGISQDDLPGGTSWDESEWPDFPELSALYALPAPVAGDDGELEAIFQEGTDA